MSTNGHPKSAQPAINMLSEGTAVSGKISTKDDIRISGTLSGDLQVKGKFILSKTGTVKGNVDATEADIAGRIDGELITTEKLILRQSAKVSGDINTRVLLIEEGAQFEGSCSMSSNPSEKKEKLKEKAAMSLQQKQH